MKTIYKYAVDINDDINVDMPEGAQVLCVQVQNSLPCIWALVDDKAKLVPYSFKWRGTGHPCGGIEGDKYVGTVQLHGGALVFHLFQS